MEPLELAGMHVFGPRGSGEVAVRQLWSGVRFLGGCLALTLVLLAAGILSMQVVELAWFGVLLVFCAVTFAYLMPFLWNSVFRSARPL